MTKETKNRISAINSGIIPDGYKKTKVGIVPVEWEECHFKKMFARLKRKNTENNTNVLTISAQYGLINQEEFFNKSVASENKSNYFLLHKGDFAYNKSYSNGYPFGAIKSLKKYDKGVVSPLYICFSPTVGNSCPDFYLHYFENGLMNREIQAIAQEGARNHGLLNIGIDDFFNSYLIVPPLPEQQKIAEILSTQDKLIELYERKIEQLKTLKKGYLQKMFPKKGCKYPELRFKGFTDDWEQYELADAAEFSKGYGYSKNDLKESGTPIILYGRLYTKYETVISEVDTFAEAQPNSVYSTGREVIVPASGETAEDISRASFVDSTGILLGGDLNIIKPSSFINPVFLALTISNGNQQKELSKRAQGKSVVHIHNADLEKVVLSYPDFEEQKQIGDFYCNLDRLISLHQRKLDKEKQKKKALMQLLLTGKVRVST